MTAHFQRMSFEYVSAQLVLLLEKIFTQHVGSQIKELKRELELLTCQSCLASQETSHLVIESQVSFLSYSAAYYHVFLS